MFCRNDRPLSLDDIFEKEDAEMAEIMLEKINNAVRENFEELVLREAAKYHSPLMEGQDASYCPTPAS